jgi:hypothetical protein
MTNSCNVKAQMLVDIEQEFKLKQTNNNSVTTSHINTSKIKEKNEDIEIKKEEP